MRCLLLLIFCITTQAQTSDFKSIDFRLADSIAAEYKVKGINNLPLLTQNLTINLNTDVEKFRAIYTWVCSNISNDYNLSFRNNRRRNKYVQDEDNLTQWNKEFNAKVFKTLKRKHKTLCTGYAYLIKSMAILANIECKIINGYGKNSQTGSKDLRSPNHSWNAVKLNNKWYLCDPTWSAIKGTGLSSSQSKQRIEAYFLADPKLFSLNHFPVEEKWFLLDSNKPNFDSFSNAPILYSKAFNSFSSHDFPKSLITNLVKNETVQFKYSMHSVIDKDDIKLLIIDGNSDLLFSPESITIENKQLIFQYQFKYSGFYDVHLLIDNEAAASYSFNVSSTDIVSK
ncbi:MAG: hypothetical protein BM564_03530 [Bacteroidetes bacterium MedPE-SWsnd-G2]|nr:MAG: hypothetical protein BM564_03530 [Bacteroidetes bacterium MedPE-SWsnd-G2]